MREALADLPDGATIGITYDPGNQARALDLLGEAELQKMRKTARVLNVARGGVYNEGILKVEETHVDDNTAGGNGGGIANGSGLSGGHGPAASAAPKGYDPKGKHHEAGIVEVFGSDHGKDGVKSTLSDNLAGKNGGGLFSSGGTVTVSFTAITGNTACENGGGVYAENTDLLLE